LSQKYFVIFGWKLGGTFNSFNYLRLSSGGAIASAVASTPAQVDDNNHISDGSPSLVHRDDSSLESDVSAATSTDCSASTRPLSTIYFDEPSVDSSNRLTEISDSPSSIWGSEPVPAAHIPKPVACEVLEEIVVPEYSWDSESDDDSLMPRNLHRAKDKGISAWTWEFLKDDLPTPRLSLLFLPLHSRWFLLDLPHQIWCHFMMLRQKLLS
jgi:hypothetical protein